MASVDSGLDLRMVLSDSVCVKILRYTFGLVAVLFLFCSPKMGLGATDPWKAKPTCVFGMPYMEPVVKPHVRGMVNEIFKAVFEPEGIVFKHESMPYKRAITQLGQGMIDCTLDLKGSGKKLLQGRATLAFYDLSAAHLKTTKWEGVKSLSGKFVAYRYGFNIASMIPVKFTLRQVYALSSGFQMLEQGQADFVLDAAYLLSDALRESRLPSHEFTLSPIKSYEVRPAFATTDQGRRYRAIYDRRMKELVDSGELREIMERSGVDAIEIKRVLDAN